MMCLRVFAFWFSIALLTPAFAGDYGSIVVDRVCSVYDGDTFKVDIDNWPPIIGKNIPIRIAGIDCPEIKGQEADKVAAVKAKNMLQTILISAKKIELLNIRRGKYFRIVADVYADGVDVKTLMICKDYGEQ